MRQEILWDSEYQYDLEIEDNVYTLWYSSSECWQQATRNTIALRLINTGNYYQVIGLEKKGRLNYSESEELYILLASVKDSKIEIVTAKKEL